MWLNLYLLDIEMILKISDYEPVKNRKYEYEWCSTDLSLVSNNWLNYQHKCRSIFWSSEIDELAILLDKLLKGQINEAITM